MLGAFEGSACWAEAWLKKMQMRTKRECDIMAPLVASPAFKLLEKEMLEPRLNLPYHDP